MAVIATVGFDYADSVTIFERWSSKKKQTNEKNINLCIDIKGHRKTYPLNQDIVICLANEEFNDFSKDLSVLKKNIKCLCVSSNIFEYSESLVILYQMLNRFSLCPRIEIVHDNKSQNITSWLQYIRKQLNVPYKLEKSYSGFECDKMYVFTPYVERKR